MSTRTRPASVCLATTATVKAAVAALVANGCTKEQDTSGGYLTVKDGDAVVYRALQKGKGGPWIVSAYNSDRITWTN